MPETFGKRQRQSVKAQKAAARDERRIARNKRRELREAGLLDEPEIAAPLDLDELLGPPLPNRDDPLQAAEDEKAV